MEWVALMERGLSSTETGRLSSETGFLSSTEAASLYRCRLRHAALLTLHRYTQGWHMSGSRGSEPPEGADTLLRNTAEVAWIRQALLFTDTHRVASVQNRRSWSRGPLFLITEHRWPSGTSRLTALSLLS
ncbi:hypothetical protein O6H91_07G094400 [Diphasiastrum complanatum]|uniref:Uncharacterized protein n=1 Tax=Diphasiastrum complanatum TaxID=34168 RepID=A0ACC2D872_DIPCM|nr:hypothetical protein O6H91_07G094400 [Diphasiastrum complanatum]